MFRKLLLRLVHPHSYSSESYVKYLKSIGIEIGDGTYFFDSPNTSIDIQRPHLIKIGNNVKIASGVKILAHDYCRSTVFQATRKYVPDYGFTSIGDNSFLGLNSIYLMGAQLGRNCIVGAGSIVTSVYPDNSVIAGSPAKLICTVSDLAARKDLKAAESAVDYAINFFIRFKRWPTVREMSNSFCWLYLPHSIKTLEEYPDLFQLHGINNNLLINQFLKSDPTWNSFSDFISYCSLRLEDKGK